MSGPFEWRIQDIERTANRAESRLYELDSLRSDVGSLEHTVRELRAEIDGLRAELQASQIQHTQDIAELREVIDARRMKMDNPNQLLDDLVKALDSTYWSSWQTTAKFDKQLDAAREYVEKLKG